MQPAFQVIPLWLQVVLVIAPALFAGVGLILNANQTRKSNAQVRAALVAGCLKGFLEDEEIQKAFYSIEYSEFKYDRNFHKSAQEREIDKLLRHFANLALSWQASLLSTEDVKPVQYYIMRVLNNTEVVKYLDWLAGWTSQQGLGEHPYAVLRKMANALAKP
jgi:hypothetical protein